MRDLPDTHKSFRGNLTMPPNATPEDHRRVKETFLQSLRRWKKRTGIVLEIHAFLHATDPHNAHWDFVGFHDGRPKAAHEAIRDLWVRSGGLRASCVGMGADEHEAVNRYQTHGRPIIKRTVAVSRQPVYVFRPRAEMTLDIVWYTSGFWLGSSLDAVWSLLIREWFGEDEDLTALEVLEQAQRDAERAERVKGGARIFVPPPAPPPYVPGEDVKQDRIHFVQRLPRTPADAVGITTYASRWGVSSDYMLSVLRSCPEAKCLDGWVDPQTGCHVFNAWHRE